jgi:hypothetical protein
MASWDCGRTAGSVLSPSHNHRSPKSGATVPTKPSLSGISATLTKPAVRFIVHRKPRTMRLQ